MSPLDPASHAGDLPESDDSAHGPNKSEHGASDVNGHADIHANGSTTNGVLATLDNRLPSVPSAGWSFGPPHRPEILTAKPGPVELLHSVRRRWPLAIGLGTLVGGIAAALVWFFVPVRYEAFALLRVSNKNPSILNKSGAAVEEFAIYKRT